MGQAKLIASRRFDEFRSLLLQWYLEKDKRTFPWRQTTSSYNILIAEIMLQRTKADQVAPVFLSFIQRFPSPEALCSATQSDVDFYFSKLGLLWRAKKVRGLCEKLIKEFKGQVPNKKEQLKTLPGVGDYIAAAVLCFAFKEKVAIIDSNVCRVLGRVFSLTFKGEARRSPIFLNTANSLVPTMQCREFNWAIIDLASLVCLPKMPICRKCPLNAICDYAQQTDNPP